MKKILIIEDDKYFLNILLKKLEKEGYSVISASEGISGIKKLKEEKPDLVILDLVLPGINGFEILKRAKMNPKTKEIPIIILSNLGQEQEVEKGLRLGASDFLIKAHFTPQMVIEKIKKYL